MSDGAPATVWPVLHYADTEGALTFLVDVLGFRAVLLARDDDARIQHAELRWPDGGTVLFGWAGHTDGVHGDVGRGTAAMYVPTTDVDAVHGRLVTSGRGTVVAGPHRTTFGSGDDAYALTVSDPEGHLWTFGTYRGAPG
ncbi:VOC family protein [Iamia majanohamensis]|uniref:VOC family protein n=1 Tax=Iamia majanohamensis TaxID=467976 RepID=A0AAE9Y4R5_9ACTN|nr:VOC family protein [Iamia majanohamensis]WCO66225.1 VOC family protein [Iamia majanohamensis]